MVVRNSEGPPRTSLARLDLEAGILASRLLFLARGSRLTERQSHTVNSTRDLLHQILDPNLSSNERAQLRCQLAAQLEHAGNYEAAQDAMGELWQGVGTRPDFQGLDRRTAADVLLRVGALTGSVGSTKQIEG